MLSKLLNNNKSLSLLLVLVALGLGGYFVYHFYSKQTPNTPQNPQDAKQTTASNNVPPPPDSHFCPKPSELVKNNLLWQAPGGWRSYTSSFVNAIESFGGAQWIGIQVGKIICLYQGSESDTFPVSIERDNLVRSPEGYRWGKDLGGYKKCLAFKIEDCPFIMVKSASDAADPESIYEGLDKKN